MIRNILAVIVGLVAAVICFVMIEMLNTSLHNSGDPTTANLSEQSTRFWLILLFGWMLGSFLAGFIIKKISRSQKLLLPLIAGSILTLSGVANVTMVQHPIWVIIVGLPIFITMTIIGHKLAKTTSL